MYRLLKAQLGSDAWIPYLYRHSESGRFYKPHHARETAFVLDDSPRYNLVRGGEGSGKSVGGIIKDLERLRRGMNGIMGSPNLPHFKRSLWPEFKRWCPWDQVTPDQQRRGRPEWEPQDPFTLTFKNGAQVICGGFESPGSWEGPNVSWGHFDEARHAKEPGMLKVLDGRARIRGPGGEPPQLWLTTTPRKNWLYVYFGPWLDGSKPDPFEKFKKQSRDLILRTQDNEANTFEGYAEQRGSTLTESEKRVLLEAGWEDIDDVDRFLPSMLWWDANCYDAGLPRYDREPVVLGVDAGIKNDNFALVGVSRDPRRREDLALRLSRVWKPKPGQPLDFDQIEEEIIRLKNDYHIVSVVYDPYALHQMMDRVGRYLWCEEFNQGARRLEADKQLLDLITQGRIKHDGTHPEVREHLDNADRKVDPESRKVRIVKRVETAKIDLAVALSMAAHECLTLNL